MAQLIHRNSLYASALHRFHCVHSKLLEAGESAGTALGWLCHVAKRKSPEREIRVQRNTKWDLHSDCLASGACTSWLGWTLQPVLSPSDSATCGGLASFLRRVRNWSLEASSFFQSLFNALQIHKWRYCQSPSWPDVSTSKSWHRCHITLDWWCGALPLLPALALATYTGGHRVSLWEIALVDTTDGAMPMPVQTSIGWFFFLWTKSKCTLSCVVSKKQMYTPMCGFPQSSFHRSKMKTELVMMPISHNTAHRIENHFYGYLRNIPKYLENCTDCPID